MIYIEDDGTIFLYQGDSGEIVINGLDDDKSYTVCFAIQDENRKLIGEELKVSVSNSSTVTFVLTPEYTDLLTVPKTKPYKIYYYGIKVCVSGKSIEDTLFIADSTYGDLNRLIVYPRKVIGGVNVTQPTVPSQNGSENSGANVTQPAAPSQNGGNGSSQQENSSQNDTDQGQSEVQQQNSEGGQ